MRTRMLYLAVLALGVLPGCLGTVQWGRGTWTPTDSLKASAIACEQTAIAVTGLITAGKLTGDTAEGAVVLLERWEDLLKRWRAAIALGQYAGTYDAQAGQIQQALFLAQVQGAKP